MKYEVKIPEPSAKRLVNRKVIVNYYQAWGSGDQQVYDVPDGDDTFVFESKMDVIPYNSSVFDGNYHEVLVEYRNSTSTRVERIRVKPTEL